MRPVQQCPIVTYGEGCVGMEECRGRSGHTETLCLEIYTRDGTYLLILPPRFFRSRASSHFLSAERRTMTRAPILIAGNSSRRGFFLTVL